LAILLFQFPLHLVPAARRWRSETKSRLGWLAQRSAFRSNYREGSWANKTRL